MLQTNCPDQTTCYCPVIGDCENLLYTINLNSLVVSDTNNGNHNRQYFFTIVVTNNARSKIEEHVDILLDDSPPVPGVVNEGPVDSLDIDYTSDDAITAHWHGFIDHESGIKLYRAGVADHCLEVTDFQEGSYSNEHITVIETDKTVEIFQLALGKNYVTVVAYNNAMEPSTPVCTDGIMLDKATPVFTDVTLTRGRIVESLACSNSQAWLIQHNIVRMLLDVNECVNRCSSTGINAFVELLPISSVTNSNTAISDSWCSTALMYNDDTMLYLPSDIIHITWTFMDTKSQIAEVVFGIGSDRSQITAPDILDYEKCINHLEYKGSHTGLGTQSYVFLFIKATNKASLTHTAILGPLLVDETPPLIEEAPIPILENGEVVLGWSDGTFNDPEQQGQIESMYYQIRKCEHIC
jgi:hypothetical protein